MYSLTIFVNVGVEVCFRELGWLLEFSAAPTTWPSTCRCTYGVLDLNRSLIFNEHFVVMKLLLSGNFCE
jgi:hypothetical protein